MNDQGLQALIDIISGDRPPRVWSLLVTVFGELAQDTPSKVSGAMLNQLTGLLGIRPEAMRVALHRLRKDGWIESERDGRTSTYQLTQWGLAQSTMASPRIYGAISPQSDAWLVQYDPSVTADVERDGVAVTPSLYVSAQEPKTSQVFKTRLNAASHVPNWLCSRICEPEICAKSKALAAKLAKLCDTLPDVADLSALQIAAVRVLIVHTWRRIILKVPELPDTMFPSDWSGPECRKLVAELLNALPRQSLSDLEAQVSKPVQA